MVNNAKSYNFTVILSILVLAGSASIMSTDLYTPSMPHMPAYFDTTPHLVKLTISLNLLMFGVAQLFHGPLSDRFGRRPVLLFSILLFTVLSFACAAAQTIGQLIAARMLQGFTAAAEAVICLAIFKDLFDEKQQIKALAIYGMAIAVAPAIGPIIGGYIHVLFGWRMNFVLTAAIGLLTTFLIWALLRESSRPDPQALRPGRLGRDYLYLITNRRFLIYSSMVGIGLGMIYVFVTGAPFILIHQFGVRTQHFGYYQAVVVAAFFMGSVIAIRLTGYWEASKLLNLGLGVMVAGGLILMALIFGGGLSAATLTASFSLMTFGTGPLFAVAPSKAMQAAERGAGSAAAMFGAFEMSVSGLAAGAISVFHDGTARPMGITLGVLVLGAVLLGRLVNQTERARKRKPAD